VRALAAACVLLPAALFGGAGSLAAETGTRERVYSTSEVRHVFARHHEPLVGFRVGGRPCLSLASGKPLPLSRCLPQQAPSAMPPSSWNWLVQGQTFPVPLELLLPRRHAQPSLRWEFQVLRFRSADDAKDGAAVTPDVDEGGVAESALRVANVLLVYRRGTGHLGNARAALRELATR
jgi:hypothetical protein